MRITRLFAALTIAALIITATAGTAFAFPTPTTWYVDDDGMGSATGCDGSQPIPSSIQDAIDAASAGDTVMVCPGTYPDDVSVSVSDLTVRAVKRWTATIVTPPVQNPNTDLITIQGVSGVVLHGFRILSSPDSCEAVSALVHVNDAPNTIISGNRLSNPAESQAGCTFDEGVRVTGASAGTQVLLNRITDFEVYGIDDSSAGSVTIRNNHINYFHASRSNVGNTAAGIYAAPDVGGVAKIRRNRIESLATAGDTTPDLADGIHALAGSDELDIRHNLGRNLRTFLYVRGGGSGVIQGNHAGDNIGAGLVLAQASGVEVLHNEIGGTDVGIDVDVSAGGNNIHDNNWDSPGIQDCTDSSSGTGTSNTDNTWTNNYGGESSPTGICTPAP